MTATTSWKFEIGANVKHAYHAHLSGVISKRVLVQASRTAGTVPAYEVKNGRRRFVIEESDTQAA